MRVAIFLMALAVSAISAPASAQIFAPWEYWGGRGYWRDIGTLDAYRAAQRDVLGPAPRFSLDNPKWPIRAAVSRVPEAAAMSA